MRLNQYLWRIITICSLTGLFLTTYAPTQAQTADTSAIRRDTVALVPTVADTLLKVRLAKLQKDIPLNYHKAVQAYVDYFTFRRASTTKLMLERIPLFFPLYEKMLAQYELPDELKYLSVVESSLNPRAVSHAGAGGLWQFMPGTGRDMKLYQDDYVDERMDPVKATEAACKYLRDLYTIFEDWELAMAAYNCGPGVVKRAMRRTGGTTYYAIYDALPKETRGYVPQFVAFTYILNHAADHGIIGENFQHPIPTDTMQVTGYFNLETFARHGRLPLAELQRMNPAITTAILPEYTDHYPLRVPRQYLTYVKGHRRAIMDSAGRMPVVMDHMLMASSEDIRYGNDSMSSWTRLGTNGLAVVPSEVQVVAANDEDAPTDTRPESVKKAAVTAKLAVAESADEPEEDIETVVLKKPRKQTYVVKRKDNLGDLADRFHVELYDLKRWNHLKSNALQPGQKLVILNEVAETRSERLAEQGTAKARKKAEAVAQTRHIKPRYHRVQDGDTLWNIAQRYDGLTIDRLKRLNNIRTNALRPGQKLIVG